MKIELHQIKIRELAEDYQDLSIQEEGITGYSGRLNIRPKYQREFVYDDKKRNAVMDTVWNGFPLNVMYWVRVGDDQFELLDGQQRTISICSFIAGEYLMNFDGNLLGFNNMTDAQKERILNYELQVYICEGTDEEQLKWFNIINIAGEKLTEQEIRNAVYSGPWVTQAKRRFSKTGCVAYKIASDYMSGSPIRQDYFEKALKWIGDAQDKTVEQYMAEHQHDTDADQLWQYFQDVIHWTEKLFGRKYKKEMKSVDWAFFTINIATQHSRQRQSHKRFHDLWPTLMCRRNQASFIMFSTMTFAILASAPSTTTRNARFTKGKAVSAPFAASISRLNKWKPTISRLGAMVAEPCPRIVKCYARNVTDEKAGNDTMILKGSFIR